ncbi:MAG: ABC transporter ATP-binding protein [Burkholderiales bacterium]|nr:ABC transporter ATP-binding protein [Burkholderiales bacterium]MDP2398902.1 ABC transporter ATP-binding protein [Burkholderiales bacterium]
MLSLRHLHKAYRDSGERPVLRDIGLELRPGDYVAIVGESGSGKSTLLNLIAGLELPDSGNILFEEQDLVLLDDNARTRLRRQRMGFVFQAFLLLPHLTVLDNAALSLKLNGVGHRESQQRAAALLDAMGLSAHVHRFPGTLSGGESQRVAIARALAHQPGLVLADEPTGNLDAGSASQVLRLLREQVKSRGSIGILVTHSSAAAASTDRVFRLADGILRPE